MTESSAKLIIFSAVATFAVCLWWKRPVTDPGKLTLKLCLFNALGWLIVLPVPDTGHPPPFVLAALLFWLLNLLLMPVTATALWACRKEGEERVSFLWIAVGYVTANVLALYVLPLVILIRG